MASSTHPAAEIRRLWPADMPTFRDHLLRLDAQSRHERFGGGMSDDFIIHYAESCFGQGDLVFGAFVDGQMHGAGELRSNEAIWTEQAPYQRHIHAEAAFSVEEAYRRRGIGEQLFRRIEGAASNHGVETIDIVCMPDNISMLRLAAKFKTQFSFEENQMTGRLTARRPTAFSMLREASRDVMDFTTSLFDAQLRAIELGVTKSA
ncbi:MAG: N-acetyltransferase family protein [Roseiarcus sp.]